MNTRLKIAAGVIAGLIAGVTLMGTAFAAPALLGTGAGAWTMMTAPAGSASSTYTRWPTIAEMTAFMNRYRTPNGTIDVQRMHSDIASGKVTPPCFGTRVPAASGGSATTVPQNPQSFAPRGPAVMQGWRRFAPAAGYGMMRRAY